MRVGGKLIAGGLVGFACIFALIGHSEWTAHAVAALVACLAIVVALAAEKRGQRAAAWYAVPYLALVALFFYAWF